MPQVQVGRAEVPAINRNRTWRTRRRSGEGWGPKVEERDDRDKLESVIHPLSPDPIRTEPELTPHCRLRGASSLGASTDTPSHTSTYTPAPDKSFHINQTPIQHTTPTCRQRVQGGVGSDPAKTWRFSDPAGVPPSQLPRRVAPLQICLGRKAHPPPRASHQMPAPPSVSSETRRRSRSDVTIARGRCQATPETMSGTTTKLTSATEEYFADLRRVRASGGRDSRTVAVRSARGSPEGGRRDAQAQGVLRSRAGRSRRWPIPTSGSMRRNRCGGARRAQGRRRSAA